MNLFELTILAVIQGLTEFLPISSSGHLILLPYIWGWNTHSSALDIFLHAGTLLALVFYYRKKLTNLIKNRNDNNKKLLTNIFLSTIPLILLAIPLRNLFESSENQLMISTIFMILVGIILIICEFSRKSNSMNNLKPQNSFVIGLFQVLSVIPGVSRSGITLIGGITQSLSKKEALDFAFLSGIPITAFALIYQLIKFKEFSTIDIPTHYYLISFIVTFIVGVLSLKLLSKVVSSGALAFFGIYRIILGLVMIILLLK